MFWKSAGTLRHAHDAGYRAVILPVLPVFFLNFWGILADFQVI
jgi:hypothetical protein